MTLALDMRGSDVVQELSREGDSISVRLMIREVGRIVDRLAKLDLLLSGDVDTWTKVATGRDSVIEVRVDHPLAESRQQTTALRHLLAEIERQRGGTPGAGAGGGGEVDGLDGL
ncbi:terminase small subunit [Gordonia phage William]|uniref:Terminase small subunit n=1 Tax=Gordonia phage William TaxID=2571253 RepID=A0A4Y6EEG4_9CAUD|nr:terminase small subunit [Gordonia phage William]QDF17096.1 terminase small subunit [Gordonia phage William]